MQLVWVWKRSELNSIQNCHQQSKVKEIRLATLKDLQDRKKHDTMKVNLLRLDCSSYCTPISWNLYQRSVHWYWWKETIKWTTQHLQVSVDRFCIEMVNTKNIAINHSSWITSWSKITSYRTFNLWKIINTRNRMNWSSEKPSFKRLQKGKGLSKRLQCKQHCCWLKAKKKLDLIFQISNLEHITHITVPDIWLTMKRP